MFWTDTKHAVLPGSSGFADVKDDTVYLAMSFRNAGNGFAVIRSWQRHRELDRVGLALLEPGSPDPR